MGPKMISYLVSSIPIEASENSRSALKRPESLRMFGGEIIFIDDSGISVIFFDS